MKRSAQQAQETLARPKILALGQTKIAEGKVKSLDQAVREIKSGRRVAPDAQRRLRAR